MQAPWYLGHQKLMTVHFWWWGAINCKNVPLQHLDAKTVCTVQQSLPQSPLAEWYKLSYFDVKFLTNTNCQELSKAQ